MKKERERDAREEDRSVKRGKEGDKGENTETFGKEREGTKLIDKEKETNRAGKEREKECENEKKACCLLKKELHERSTVSCVYCNPDCIKGVGRLRMNDE